MYVVIYYIDLDTVLGFFFPLCQRIVYIEQRSIFLTLGEYVGSKLFSFFFDMYQVMSTPSLYTCISSLYALPSFPLRERES